MSFYVAITCEVKLEDEEDVLGLIDRYKSALLKREEIRWATSTQVRIGPITKPVPLTARAVKSAERLFD